MNQKKRLDVAVFERNLAESREKAKALIMSGVIYVNDVKQTKAGFSVSDSDAVELRGKGMPYVSRGGYKLEKAIKEFKLDLNGLICMDVGASTGGFTDAMLQNGAAKVYSVDVGYGQLAWKLRNDERVINLERTNFRYCTSKEIPDPIDFSSVDVSFISLKLILPVLHGLLAENGECVCLIKPQFEAGREKVGKNGVVKEIETHTEVVNEICSFALNSDFDILDLDFSPVKGPQGNIEYLLHLRKCKGEGKTLTDVSVDDMVRNSHHILNNEKV